MGAPTESVTVGLLRQHSRELAEQIVALQYRRQAELWEPFEEAGREKSMRDAAYHLSFLAEAVEADDALLLGDYLAWVKVLFAGLRFPDHVLPTILDCTCQVLAEELPGGEREAALHLLDVGARDLALAPTSVPPCIQGDTSLDGLARRYLDALLRADRQAAIKMVLYAVQGGVSVGDVYRQVFRPTLCEIGRLWHTSQISVAQEHYCTATTQLVMSLLYPHVLNGIRKNRSIVVACAGGELHELGARMVSDFFEMEGWDSHFLGANTPPESIVRAVADRRPDVLALSVTMTFHVHEVRATISSLRQHSRLYPRHRTRILVGGYPFNISTGLWRNVGADGYAADAESAITEAERMLAA
jgi:MerR family transcriptional regulator, light-induced transcriptional regulator